MSDEFTIAFMKGYVMECLKWIAEGIPYGWDGFKISPEIRTNYEFYCKELRRLGEKIDLNAR